MSSHSSPYSVLAMISSLKNTKFALTYCKLIETLESEELDGVGIDKLDRYILLSVQTSNGVIFRICEDEEQLEYEIVSVVFDSDYISHSVYPPLHYSNEIS